MFQRVLLWALCVALGVLAYCLLAFGLGSRAVQALALPVLGLAVLSIARYTRGQTEVRRSLFVTTLFVVLTLGVVVEGFALAKIAQRQPQPYSVESSLGLKHRIRALLDQQLWKGVVDLAESTGPVADPEVLLDIGYAHNKMGNFPEAKSCYEHSIRLDPANPAARYELARLYERTGDFVTAAETYERILETNDSLPDVHFAYGVLLGKLGQLESGVGHVKRAVSLYPNGSPLQQRAAHALAALRTEGRP